MTTLLVISEDASTVRRLKSALAKAAPECDILCAGKWQAANIPKEPAVILLDLTIASEPAAEVLRRLRSERRFEKIPVFAFGSEVLKSKIEEAYALGANSCFAVNGEPSNFEPIAGGIATYASILSAGFSPACA